MNRYPRRIDIDVAGLLFTGDSLFLKNVGRTDLPGGDASELARSLARLSTCAPNAQVLPGHSRTDVKWAWLALVSMQKQDDPVKYNKTLKKK